jgi:hypothetical protein
MVKGGALVGFLGAARTTVKCQSGGAAFRLPACWHRRISAPGCARVRLRTPEGDALPPSVCECASQRLDLGGELGDGASKHTTAPQPGKRTTARYKRGSDSSDEYGELQVKPFVPSRACMHASARNPSGFMGHGQEVLDKTPNGQRSGKACIRRDAPVAGQQMTRLGLRRTRASPRVVQGSSLPVWDTARWQRGY